jgi:hypothetical protein
MNQRIIDHFATPQLFHEEALKYFQPAPLVGDDLKAFYAKCWTFSVYHFLKNENLAGRLAKTLPKLFTEIALDYYQLRQKNYLWLEIERKFGNLWGTLQWTTIGQEKYHHGKNLSSFGKQSEETQTAPLFNSLAGGATPDFSQLNKTIVKGFYQNGKFSPNVDLNNSDGWKQNTQQHQEQSNQNIAKIITAMLSCQVYFGSYLNKYLANYTWRWATPPGNLVITPMGKFQYTSPKKDEDDDINIDGAPKKPTFDPNSEEISVAKWEQMLKSGQKVERTYYLEYLARKKKRTQQGLKGKGGGTLDNEQRKIKAIEELMPAYARPIYLPPLPPYDKVMKTIEGFEIFKAELRLRLELMHDNKSKGIEKPIKPMCLLGPPGVGKTEIVKRYAKAMRRPLIIISMGGANDTKDIEGTPPTFQSANWSQLLEGLAFTRVDVEVELDELKEQLAEYQAITNKTEFQEQEINELTKLIKEMTDNDQTKLTIDANSKAPIFLFDESEKVMVQAVIDALGKVLDPNVNKQHKDKFLEGALDLQHCIFFLTMNHRERAPGFVLDRCDMIDIWPLTYQQRINVLTNFTRQHIRDTWPIMDSSSKKPDYPVNKKAEEDDTLNNYQQGLVNKVGQKILEACLTENWGVRQALINLEKVINLMQITEKEGKLKDLDNLDNWNWDSDKDGEEDDRSDKTRILKYDVLTDSAGNSRPLQLTKQVDQEFIPVKNNTKWAKVLTVKNTIKSWPGYSPIQDETYQESGEVNLTNQLEQLKREAQAQLFNKEQINEQQRILLENTLNKLSSAVNAEQLPILVANLRRQILAIGQTPNLITPQTKTFIVKNIPEDGKYRWGVNAFQQTIEVLQFDSEEAKKITNLRISNCLNLVQLDLSSLINLAKLSLRDSYWDAVKGADKLTKPWKLVIKNCQNVSLSWLENTQVETVEIDKPSEKQTN